MGVYHAMNTSGGIPRVFSPSSTSDWLQCPQYFALRREGWRPRRLAKKDFAAILGTAFAKGIAVYNAARKENAHVDIRACVSTAQASAVDELAALDALGCVTSDADSALRLALPRRIDAALTKYVAQDPIPTQWKIRDVELILPRGGGCRIDLGLETDLGPVVLDYKTKLTLDAKYAASTREDYRYSEQRFHYPYWYSEHLGRPVHAFYICLLVLEPRFTAELIPFVVNPDEGAQWLRSRTQTWQLIHAERKGDLTTQMATGCKSQYGPCEFRRACWDCLGDEGLMASEYVKVGRRD